MIPQPARPKSARLVRLSLPKVSSVFSSRRPLCLLVCALCVNSFFPSACPAQNLDKPLQSIDEDITAFAYAPDGRIVYSVYRRVKTKVYDALEHDDIWIQD